MTTTSDRTKIVQARNQSRAFMLAAQRCNEPRPLPSGRFQLLIVPSLVCYAFSIEVGLKALALHERGAAMRSHDLKELLGGVPPTLRAQIVADTADPTFDSDLELVRGVFETWRYIYEQGLIDTDLGFLQRLAAAVQKALEIIA